MRSFNSRRLVVLAFLVLLLLLATMRTRLIVGDSLLAWKSEAMRRIVGTSGYHASVALTQRRSSSSLRQGGRENAAPAYAPGTYMAGRRPENHTICAWRYGLPNVLAYSTGKVTGTPQAGERGPYRVLPFITRGHTRDERLVSLPNLTLCTHATADQVYHVVELARRWQGPVSLAIFAPGIDAGLAVAVLERACRCEPEMAKVSVHLVFPAGRPPALGATKIQRESVGDCAASDLQLRASETERKQRGMTYPINVARNVARNLSRTSRVLVSDIELLPSDGLARGFIDMIEDREPRIGVVFVLPTFEIESGESVPRDKRNLLAAVKSGLAVYFHRFVCIHCQRFPGMTKWMLKPDPGKVRPLIVTKREYPYHRWEPVFIGTKDDPMYNEDMSWEGRQDKMAQMLQMCLMKYRLIVLDGAFLVHTPGIKYKSWREKVRNDDESYEWNRSEEKRNSRIYQSFTRRLLERYPNDNGRCGL